MKKDIEILRYPIGKFQQPEQIGKEQLDNWIKIIDEFPKILKNEVENITEKELAKPYRPNCWTITQVVNHCADSHMNSFIRFKLALTEETPTIKPYIENLWAELSDSQNYPIENSIKILEGLHGRWTSLMKSLSEKELDKYFIHPENNEKISLKTIIGIYAWHCEHHLAHIKNAKQN